MNCTLLQWTLISHAFVCFFHSSEADFFLLPSAIIDCMLIKDFMLVARIDSGGRWSICDDRIFLIRIISKWKFAIVVTAHKIHKLLSINFVKHSCYFSKGCWDFVSVSLCNITLLFATVRSSRENAVQIIYIKTLQRLKLYPIRMGCRSIRHKLLIFLVACYTWKGKLT